MNQIDDPNTTIVVEPPDVHYLTDEDSADEEDANLNGLSANQLRAPTAIIISNSDSIDDVLDKICNTTLPDSESKSSSEPPKKMKTFKKQGFEWKKKEKSIRNQLPFSEADYNQYEMLSDIKLFELFFDDELIDLIVEQSTLYCLKNNWPNLNVSKEEIKVFLGILIVLGYNPLGSKRYYWSTGNDLRNHAIYEAVRRDRFELIIKCLHFKDNDDLDKNDKYCKLRPFLYPFKKSLCKILFYHKRYLTMKL